MNSSGPKAGRLRNVSLGEYIRDHADTFSCLPYVAIASIDSQTEDIADMPWAKKRLQAEPAWAFSGDPLVISGESLVALAHDPHIFHGFDEIWMVSSAEVPPVPNTAYLVAPRRLEESIPDEVAQWMERAGVSLGLGDGEGLNFVVGDTALARTLGLPID